MTVNALADQALASGLVQPDQTTCGSSVLVVAHAFSDASYAAFLVNGPEAVAGGEPSGTVQDRFKQAALAMHKLTSGIKPASGGVQLPWPSALGTQPWSLAREMTTLTGKTYQVQSIWPGQRSKAFSKVSSLARAGKLVPLFVGSRWVPRHVVLVLPDQDLPSDRVMLYDPASGRRYPITGGDFAAGRLDVAGWQVPWAVVVPS